MTDKMQKIRKGIEKLKSLLIRGACSSQIAMETRCKEEAYNEVLAILDTMQEEPVSEDLLNKTQTITYKGEVYTRCYKDKLDEFACKYPMSVPKSPKRYAKYSDIDLTIAVKAGAQWQKEQFEKERLKHCDALTEEQAQIESDFVTQHLKKNNRTPTFIDAIKYGMRLKEQQLMSKAIDAKLLEGHLIRQKGVTHPLHVGDKVKVIVIKED